MKKVISLLLIALMCCGMLAGCGDSDEDTEVEAVEIELPHNSELFFSSTKDEVRKSEKLIEDEFGNFKSDKKYVVYQNEFKVTYCFDALGNIDYIMYEWEEESNDTRVDDFQILNNYVESDLEERGWEEFEKWVNNKSDFNVVIEQEYSPCRYLILYERRGVDANRGVDETLAYFNKPIDTDVVRTNQLTSAINNRLEEMIKEERYENVIKTWHGAVHSINNACEVEVELQEAADIYVGTISSLRNELCDAVISEYSDVPQVIVRFKGIGTYTFSPGTGWDREVSADDSE